MSVGVRVYKGQGSCLNGKVSRKEMSKTSTQDEIEKSTKIFYLTKERPVEFHLSLFSLSFE